jgi:glucosyl-3-phosphoglycerate phosphatase
MSRRVIVLRHGRTEWNAERRFQGQADPPLDDVGRAQADQVAELLAGLRPAVIVTSDLQRATQTAGPIGERVGIAVQVDPRLRERSLGHWEGLTRDEVEQRYPDEFADWIAGRDVTRRGGETREQVAKRALETFEGLPDVEVALLVTHSATAMSLCASLIGLDLWVPALGPLANCHWSELSSERTSVASAAADRRSAPLATWRLRAHNVGAPGPVIPVVASAPADEAPDAEA